MSFTTGMRRWYANWLERRRLHRQESGGLADVEQAVGLSGRQLTHDPAPTSAAVPPRVWWSSCEAPLLRREHHPLAVEIELGFAPLRAGAAEQGAPGVVLDGDEVESPRPARARACPGGGRP